MIHYRSTWKLSASLLMLILAAGSTGSGQRFDYGLNTARYARGQNVAPIFEGWEQNPDGSFDMVFGYLNRNYEEELDIPIGPNNNIEPGGPDHGQPTFFGTRRHGHQFRVRVPKDWGTEKRLVWTLTVAGRTEKANAFLLPEWEINDQALAGHLGGVGTAPDVGENKAPDIRLGPDQTITLPSTLTLTALVSDDGLPEEGRLSGSHPGERLRFPRLVASEARSLGSRLWVEWVKWRGPAGATVMFDSAVSPVNDGNATTMVSFDAPGEYVLKGFAFDRLLMTPSDGLSVTVRPSPQTRSGKGP